MRQLLTDLALGNYTAALERLGTNPGLINGRWMGDKLDLVGGLYPNNRFVAPHYMPFIIASMWENEELVIELLKRGADMVARWNQC